jgi:hypothetical protein
MSSKKQIAGVVQIPLRKEIGPKFSGIISDSNGIIYVASPTAIYRIGLDHSVSVYAGSSTFTFGTKNGPRLEALFDNLTNMCYINLASILVVSYRELLVRQIEGDEVTTLAGTGKQGTIDGSFQTCQFYSPISIGCGIPGKIAIVCDLPHSLRLLYMETRTVTTLKCPNPIFTSPPSYWGICPSIKPGFVLTSTNTEVYEVNLTTGEHSIVYSGKGTVNDLRSVIQANDGHIFLCDTEKDCIREVEPEGRTLKTRYGIPRGEPGCGTSAGYDITELESTPKFPLWSPIVEIPKSQLKLAMLPTSIILSPSGDIWWTEYDGLIRYIKQSGHFPYAPWENSDREILLWNDFSKLLNSSLCNFQLVHNISGASITLHKEYLETLKVDLDVLNKLIQREELFPSATQSFIALLHGSPLPNVKSFPKLWFAVCYMLKEIGLIHVAEWAEMQISIFLLNGADQDSLITFLGEAIQIDSSNPPCLASICLELRKCKQLNTELLVSTILDQTLLASITLCITNLQTHLDIPNIDNLTSPWKYLAKCMKELWDGNGPKRNFAMMPAGSRQKIPVHDWMLYTRWPFFKRMIDSGLEEASTSQAELPADFPPDLIPILLQYLYCGDLDDYHQKELTPSIRSFIIDNGAEYELADMEGMEHKSFARLFSLARFPSS